MVSSSINNRGRLTANLEEHLDHIHYLQDIFLTKVDSLNNVLKEQLMNRLFIPVYVFSLIKRDKFCRVKVRVKTMKMFGRIRIAFFQRILGQCLINHRLCFFLLK